MNDLITMNVQELINKSLVKDVNKIRTELIKKDKSNFEIAKAITHIIVSENYKDDFETEKNISEALGVSKSQISMFKTVTELKNTIQSKHWDVPDEIRNIYNNLTLSKLAEIKPLIKMIDVDENIDIYFLLQDFASWNMEKYGNFGITLTQKELRERVKEYKYDFEGIGFVESVTESEATESEVTESEVTESEVTEQTESVPFITIHIGKDVYYVDENESFIRDITKLMKKYDLI